MAKIIVIDDEPDLRQLIVEELQDAGHSTVEAGNGVDGLALILDQRPDLILSDITMPKMNGYHLLRTLQREHPDHAGTPFLFLSALADRNDVTKGLATGADDYITKPIDFDMLLERVESRLLRGQG